MAADLPLKLCPEEALSLQDGNVKTTPLLLHIKRVVAWRNFDKACLNRPLTNRKQVKTSYGFEQKVFFLNQRSHI